MEEYLRTISDEAHRAQMRAILDWVQMTFPFLKYETKWNQPMFLHHGTYIIGFGTAKNHFSVAPETAGMKQFMREIREAGYSHTENLFRVKWDEPLDYGLLERMIAFNIADKENCRTFWRS